MSENKEYISHAEEHGDIYISEDVLTMIAGAAALEIEGVTGLAGGNLGNLGDQLLGKKSMSRGVTMQRNGEVLVMNVSILIQYGYAIPEVARKVQEAVTSNLEATSGLEVSAVNVRVGGITFDKQTQNP
ncbi:MAG: Asp23/Gls24 family envelope stress response protein [Evtepia sp.]